MPKTDRRVARTERALREALIGLLQRKDLSRITVRELAEEADVNRVTFYAHYDDIYALYESLCDEALARIGELLEANPSQDYAGLFDGISALMGEKRWVYLLASRDAQLRARLTALLEERWLAILAHDNPGLVATDELRVLATYHMSGLMAIVTRWARGGFRSNESQVGAYLALADQAFEAGLRATGAL